jgi:AraC-like DNA-binding protein
MAIKVMVKNPNVNIEALSDKLELPKSHVQYVFKYYADFSFVEFRSKIRVYYAVSKMQQGFLSKNTMDALAKESGFSSYNPFYAAFKSEMGLGPSEVLAQLKKRI